MIELQGITKSFGTLQVLKGIDLMIEKGEVVSIVGPSGAGENYIIADYGNAGQGGYGYYFTEWYRSELFEGKRVVGFS